MIHPSSSSVSVLLLLAAASTVNAAEPGKTLLAMGDSLAAGQLLDFEFFTDQGWANVLFEYLQASEGFDTLANVACTSERTTNFMIANPDNATECFADGVESIPPSLCRLCPIDAMKIL